MDMIEERISELEDKTIEITQFEHRENRLKKRNRDMGPVGL